MENERQPWVVHDDDEEFDVYETYTDLFSIKVNYGDSFTPKGGREYILGIISYVNLVYRNGFSIQTVNDIVKELGYSATDVRVTSSELDVIFTQFNGPLSKTALMLSIDVARYITKASPLIGAISIVQFFSILRKGRALSVRDCLHFRRDGVDSLFGDEMPQKQSLFDAKRTLPWIKIHVNFLKPIKAENALFEGVSLSFLCLSSTLLGLYVENTVPISLEEGDYLPRCLKADGLGMRRSTLIVEADLSHLSLGGLQEAGEAEVEAWLAGGVFLGVLTVKVETIMGGSSPTLGLGLIVAGPTDDATDYANMRTISLSW
nr:hypothetical protein [Tanacetum cinerariifolium]